MENKIYKKVCKICGKEFETNKTHTWYCRECAKGLMKKPLIKEAPRCERTGKSIPQVMQEMVAYNKTHGTKLSYGQFVARRG